MYVIPDIDKYRAIVNIYYVVVVFLSDLWKPQGSQLGVSCG